MAAVTAPELGAAEGVLQCSGPRAACWQGATAWLACCFRVSLCRQLRSVDCTVLVVHGLHSLYQCHHQFTDVAM